MTPHSTLTAAILAGTLFLSACSETGGIAKFRENSRLVQGPPIEDIITPFDEALECLRPRMNREVRFAVGGVNDQTGRQSPGEGGMGTYFTQGAGEMIQSAMIRAGATVVNRRNMDIPISEARWGVRTLETQEQVTFFVSGSITSLDFIPGGGASASFGGIGARARQNRILVGADLYMTDARTGLVVAGVPLQKQLVASEIGLGVGRFFGTTLTDIDAGIVEREALNSALRQMLSLATFELITTVMQPRHWLPCRAKLDAEFGSLSATRGAEVEKLVLQELEKLRQTSPQDALILERELAGEAIEDIMADLGLPMPRPAPPPAPAPAAQQTARQTPQPQLEDPEIVPPDMPEPTVTAGPLMVRLSEEDTHTTITVDAPAAVDFHWGFVEDRLLVVARNHDGSFDLSSLSEGLVSARVSNLQHGGEGLRRVLVVTTACQRCGVFGEVSEDGVLTLEIGDGEERVLLDMSLLE